MIPDLLPPVPDEIEKQISTPHEHEDADWHRPLWLVWRVRIAQRTDVPYFPELDTVCTTADSARYHIRAILFDTTQDRLWVERIPANHRFGSSLEELQMKTHMAMWKARHDAKNRTGD
jgi:hypothetical protein